MGWGGGGGEGVVRRTFRRAATKWPLNFSRKAQQIAKFLKNFICNEILVLARTIICSNKKCYVIFFGGRGDISYGTYWEHIKTYTPRPVFIDLFGRKVNAFLLSKRRKRKLPFRFAIPSWRWKQGLTDGSSPPPSSSPPPKVPEF